LYSKSKPYGKNNCLISFKKKAAWPGYAWQSTVLLLVTKINKISLLCSATHKGVL